MVFWKKFLYFLVFLVKLQKNTNKNNNVFEDKSFLGKMFSQIKIQASTNWSGHRKNIKHLIFSNDIFLMQFSKIAFSEKSSEGHVKITV